MMRWLFITRFNFFDLIGIQVFTFLIMESSYWWLLAMIPLAILSVIGQLVSEEGGQ